MHQIAARVPEEVNEAIEAFSDENDCTKSEAVRALLKRGIEYEELQRENARLQNEKRALINDREEKTELVEYVEEQRSLERQRAEREERRAKAGILTKTKWALFGMNDIEENADQSVRD